MRPLRLLAGLLLGPGLAQAAGFGSPGTAGADFTKILIAPRPAAMGGAGSALGADLGSLDLNPTSLAGLAGLSAEAAHLNWLEGVALDRVAVGWGRRQGPAWGLSYQQLGTPPIPALDVNGTETGTFSQQDRSLAAAVAWSVGSVDIGLTGRALQRQLAGLGQTGLGADLGLRWRPAPDWAVALSGQNLGSLSALEREADSAPMVLRGGLAWEHPFNDVAAAAVAVDGVQPLDAAVQLRAGVELRLYERFALRVGSQFSEAFDNRQVFTAGLGLRWQSLGLDYAWAPFGALGNSHRVGLNWNGSVRLRQRSRTRPRVQWLQARREGRDVILSWDGKGAPRWAVYLKKGAREELTRLGETGGADPKVRLKNLAANADVVFAVAPLDPELGEGPRSHQLSLAAGRPERRLPAPPQPPLRLRVIRDADGARLVWDPPTDAGAAKPLYQAYLSYRSDGGFQPLGGFNSLTERRLDLNAHKRRIFLSVQARWPAEDALMSDWAEPVSVQP